MQVPQEDLSKPLVDQKHLSLAFLSGHFFKLQLGWSTPGKESFAIMVTTGRMPKLLTTPEKFVLFTDYLNLIFLFDPSAIVPDLS